MKNVVVQNMKRSLVILLYEKMGIENVVGVLEIRIKDEIQLPASVIKDIIDELHQIHLILIQLCWINDEYECLKKIIQNDVWFVVKLHIIMIQIEMYVKNVFIILHEER